MSDKSLKKDYQVYVEEKVLNRMVQIVKEATECPESLTVNTRYGYMLMAIELYGLDIIDGNFLDAFCQVIYPDYWRYYHGYAVG